MFLSGCFHVSTNLVFRPKASYTVYCNFQAGFPLYQSSVTEKSWAYGGTLFCNYKPETPEYRANIEATDYDLLQGCLANKNKIELLAIFCGLPESFL